MAPLARIVVFLGVLSGAAPLFAQPAPAPAPSPDPQNLPPGLPEHRLADCFRASVRDGLINIDSDLPSSEPTARRFAVIDGHAGQLNVVKDDNGDLQELLVVIPAHADQLLRAADDRISIRPDQVMIGRTVREPAIMHRFSYVQQTAAQAGASRPLVTLKVSDIPLRPFPRRPRGFAPGGGGGGGGGFVPRPTDVHLVFSAEASSLDQLVREHPVEVDQYLRPTFRNLGIEPLLGASTLEAAVVLADDCPPDAPLSAKVQGLFDRLGADDPADRRAATAELQSMLIEAAPLLVRIDRSSLPPEQAVRVSRLLAALPPLSTDEGEQRRGDATFLVACLALPDPRLRAAAAKRLSEVTGKPISFDPVADDATRQRQLDVLRRQLVPSSGAIPATERSAPAAR